MLCFWLSHSRLCPSLPKESFHSLSRSSCGNVQWQTSLLRLGSARPRALCANLPSSCISQRRVAIAFVWVCFPNVRKHSHLSESVRCVLFPYVHYEHLPLRMIFWGAGRRGAGCGRLSRVNPCGRERCGRRAVVTPFGRRA